jgi:putative tricarboxylic transport membrane protein
MKKDEVIPSIAWIIIGIVICVAAAALKLGTWRRPQPGLFAFLIGCGIIALSVFHMVPQLTKKSEEGKTLFYWEGLKRIIIVFALLVFYVLSLERLGFMICTYVFFVVIFKSLGRKSWGYAIFTSLIVTILSYLVFEIWLKVNLPKGPLRI